MQPESHKRSDACTRQEGPCDQAQAGHGKIWRRVKVVPLGHDSKTHVSKAIGNNGEAHMAKERGGRSLYRHPGHAKHAELTHFHHWPKGLHVRPWCSLEHVALGHEDELLARSSKPLAAHPQSLSPRFVRSLCPSSLAGVRQAMPMTGCAKHLSWKGHAPEAPMTDLLRHK